MTIMTIMHIDGPSQAHQLVFRYRSKIDHLYEWWYMQSGRMDSISSALGWNFPSALGHFTIYIYQFP